MLVIDDPAFLACFTSRVTSDGSGGTGSPLACLIVARPQDAPAVFAAIRRDEHEVVSVRHTHDSVAHALLRWAVLVVSMRDSEEDLPTLKHWGRYVNKSLGTLVNWCSVARVTSTERNCPSASKQFARVLRAILRLEEAQREGREVSLENLLIVHDDRTKRKLMMRAGSDDPERLPTLEQFLSRQQFVTNRAAVAQVAALLGVSLPPAPRGGGGTWRPKTRENRRRLNVLEPQARRQEPRRWLSVRRWGDVPGPPTVRKRLRPRCPPRRSEGCRFLSHCSAFASGRRVPAPRPATPN